MTGIDRRTLLAAGGALAMGMPAAAGAGERKMESQPFTVGMIAFDMMTNLDFVGPFDILSRVRGARTILLGKTLDPIVTDSRYRLLPEMRLADAPELDDLRPRWAGIDEADGRPGGAGVPCRARAAREMGHIGLHRRAGAGRGGFAQGLSRGDALERDGYIAGARRDACA
jgi:hypothetical protein